MDSRESPPSRTQRRRRLATASTVFAILVTILLCYTRFDEVSFRSVPNPPLLKMPGSPMADEATKHPSLKHPTLLGSLPASALPKPGGGPDSPRLIIIGDVHGQLSALDALLHKAGYSSARRDQVVFLGDMINKGPDSPGVIDRAIAIGAWGVRGNHEDRVLRAWAKHIHSKADDENLKAEEEQWEGEGSAEEKEAVGKSSKTEKADRATAASLTPTQLSWLAKLPVILRLGTVSPYYGEVVAVHAGLIPDVPLEKQDPWAAMNMRTLLGHSSASLDPAALSKLRPSEGREGRPWAELWNALEKAKHKKGQGGKTTVVYGHDAKTGLSVRRYAFGIDSNCVRGGDLTALVFEATSSLADSSTVEDEGSDTGNDEVNEQARAKHGITHRLVSVACEKKKDKHKHKGKAKDKDKKKEKGKDI